MKRENRTNALLVELLIVILFFMLGAAILIQVFGKSHHLERNAQASAAALVDAQNVAETLYATNGDTEYLQEQGFVYSAEGEVWLKPAEGYQLRVTITDTTLVKGSIREMRLEAVVDDTVLLSLPCSKYGVTGTVEALTERGTEEMAAESVEESSEYPEESSEELTEVSSERTSEETIYEK